MEAQTSLQNQAAMVDAQPKKKVAKRRFTRLTADELKNLPGANLTVQKKIETGPSYFFEIGIPLDTQIGSAAEHQQATDFLYQLQTTCSENAVGSIISVAIAESVYQITIKIMTIGEQSSHVAPLNLVFEKLNEFFMSSQQVISRRNTAKKVTWKGKVMGTTIADGFLGVGKE